MSLKTLFQHEDKIITRMGKAFLSERVVYRGKDLHQDLQHMSWFELFIFGITGRQFNEAQMKVLNFMWISTSYPDKSIWPNNIAALAASSRSTPILALSSGLAVFEASIYAGKPLKVCIDTFYRADKWLQNNPNLNTFLKNEIKQHKIIYGYGRPLTSKDERIPHLIRFADEQGLGEGHFLKLALKIAKQMKQLKGLEMNVVAIYAALGADLGFSAKEFHLFMTPAAFAGMPPCYIEAKENPEGAFLPIRCDRIKYIGKPKRKWKIS